MKTINMLVIGLLSILILTSFACQNQAPPDDQSAVDQTRTGEGDNSSGDSDIGKPAADNGSAEYTYTSELPANWPKTVPMMEGFNIVTSMSANNDQTEGATLTITTDNPFEDIMEYYKNLEGWTIEGELTGAMFGQDGFTLSLVAGEIEHLAITGFLNTDEKLEGANAVTFIYSKDR